MIHQAMARDVAFAVGFLVVCAALFAAMAADKLLDVLVGLAFLGLVIVAFGSLAWAFFSFFGAVHDLVRGR
jgi:hypothetical protein